MTKKKWIIGILAVVAVLFLYTRYKDAKNENDVEKSLMHSYISSYQGIDINKNDDEKEPVVDSIIGSNIAMGESMGAPAGNDAIGGGNVEKKPTKAPTKAPTMTPTPTVEPTAEPTEVPIEGPTEMPIPEQTVTPTEMPTAEPTIPIFIVLPTATPVPTKAPVLLPTVLPVVPTLMPTLAPTAVPTGVPSMAPTGVPSVAPTAVPSMIPTAVPTKAPSMTPTTAPTATVAPTKMPTLAPATTTTPTKVPTLRPTPTAALVPTKVPTKAPTATLTVTVAPTKAPTKALTATPTLKPTATPMPTKAPTVRPTVKPTATPMPTKAPTVTPTPAPKKELVTQGYYDYNVIPDKFNTGCSGTLTKINSAGIVDGVEYNMGDDGGTLVIDLYYRNKGIANEVIIRNKDFSDLKFAVRHTSMTDTKRVIRFENCKFSGVSTEIEQDMVDFYFSNCSFLNFNGSDSTFTNCFFGGSSSDGMNPFKNVSARNCYFSGFPQTNANGIHTDAIQIYGKEGIDAENILFSNCRVEIPIIKLRGTGYINACFMVQLEYSNAKNFLFENCIINGGGYSVYAWDKGKGWELDNVVFRNISFGSGHLYNDIYPNKDESVTFDNLKDTEKLYVASVWKDYAGTVHLSVSNDTAEDKTLLVVTETGKQEFLIPCKKTAEAAGAMEYYDLPIDIEITVNSSGTDWVVCYDGEETQGNQIRFVNWGSTPVYRTVY